MTSNQIAYGQLKLSERMTDLEEKSLELKTRAQEHTEYYDARMLELKEKEQEINKQISDLNRQWDKEKTALELEMREREATIKEKGIDVQQELAMLELEYKDRQLAMDAYFKEQGTFWEKEKAANDAALINETSRHNIEMENFNQEKLDLEREANTIKASEVSLSERELEFKKYSFDESQEFRWAELGLSREQFTWDQTHYWYDLGIKQRQNNLTQEYYNIIKERNEWLKEYENKKFIADTTLSVGEWITNGLKIAVPFL